MIRRNALLMSFASGAVMPTIIDFSGADCEFSRISGITCVDESTRYRSGLSQSRWVKLDFTTSSQSFLYSSKACPFGLSDCWDEDHEDLMKPLRISNLDIYPPSIPDLSFETVSLSDPALLLETGGFKNRVLRSRDVHASIAFGPNSPIYQGGSVLEVSDLEWHFKNVAALRFSSQEESVGDSFFVPLLDSEGSEGWELLGQLQVNDVPISGQLPIRIDPGADEIIIPLSFTEQFVGSMKEITVRRINGGRLYVECNKKNAPRLSLQFGSDDRVLKIKRIQLLTSNLTSTACALRIVFSDSATSITVGRSLLRSIQKVILDSRNKRVGFSRRKSAKLGQIIDRPSRVPYFACNSRSVQHEEVLLLRLPLGYGTSYILLNSEFSRDSQLNSAQCVYLFNPLGQEQTLVSDRKGLRYGIARGRGWPIFHYRSESPGSISEVLYTFDRSIDNLQDPVSFWLEIYGDSHAKICIESIPEEHEEGTSRESTISLVEGGTDRESISSSENRSDVASG